MLDVNSELAAFLLILPTKANNEIFNCVFIDTEHFIMKTPDAQYVVSGKR